MINCVICGSNEHWENVDRFKYKKTNMSVCKNCGMVQHLRFKNNDEAKAFYKGTDYRGIPSANNLFTSLTKMQYHTAFLEPLVKDWKTFKLNPTICDVGAATGVFLHWLKGLFPEGKITGTEWTLSFRRVCYYQYGIKLTEEFNKDLKYDLISYYKVLEHIIDADVKLKECVEALTPQGKMYISNPTWFNHFTLFGLNDQPTVDRYFDENHVNVWTEKHSKNLLKNAGLKILKDDYTMYDSTYLCERTNEKHEIEKEDYKEIIDRLDRIKKAFDFFEDKKPLEAIKAWENYPVAWRLYYEFCRNELHNQGGYEAAEKTIIEPALKATNNHFETLLMKADIQHRYNKFKEAIDTLQEAARQRPNNPACLEQIANILYATGNYGEVANLTAFLMQTYPQMLSSALSLQYAAFSAMPFEGE